LSIGARNWKYPLRKLQTARADEARVTGKATTLAGRFREIEITLIRGAQSLPVLYVFRTALAGSHPIQFR